LRRTLPARGLALLTALAVAHPATVGDLPLTVVALAGAWLGAPPVADRPLAPSARWRSRLGRHRNTVLAAGLVVLAAIRTPPLWLGGAETALILAYLLLLDSRTGGPPGRRRLRPLPLLAAYGASLLVLAAGSIRPEAGGSWWLRLVAVVALAGTAAAVAVALGARRPLSSPRD